MSNIKEIYLSIKEAADFLGLKYHHTRNLLYQDTTHHTRNLLYQDTTLVCYSYGRTKRWKLSDIVDFRERHMIGA